MSNVKTAVGIEKQFSPQPRDLYQKNLQGLSGNIRVDVDASTKYQDLARSLGVLGDTLEADFISKEKNKKKIGIAEAERIISSQSEEDMMKLSAIELLNNHSEHSIADNPYAITTIEKMRGKYFGARAKTEYDVWRKDQPPVKEASEEVARYTKYVQDTYGEVSGVATDQEAFQKGFYDNFIPDQKEKADGFLKEKANEMDVIRKGSALAEATEIMENAKQFTPTEVAERLTNLFKEATLAGQSYKDKWELAGFITDSYAKLYGDVDGLQQIREETLIGSVDPKTGNPLRLSDFYPASDAYRMAEVRAFQINNEGLRAETERLKKLSVPELHEYKDNLFNTDIKEFNKMLPVVESLITAREKQDAAMAKEKLKAQIAEGATSQAYSILDENLEAYEQNADWLPSGRKRASSRADLQEIDVPKIMPDGSISYTKEKMTDEQLEGWYSRTFNKIWDSNLPPKEKINKMMTLLDSPWSDQRKKSFAQSVQGGLDSITSDQVVQTIPTSGSYLVSEETFKNGGVVSNPQVDAGLTMWALNPEKAARILGDKTTAELQMIQTLAQGEGNIARGLSLYAAGRDNYQNEALRSVAEKQVRALYDTIPLQGFVDMRGNERSLSSAASANWQGADIIEKNATFLVLAGKPPQEALKMAQESFRKTQYVYRDTFVPRSLGDGFLTEHKAAVLEDTLNWLVEDYKQRYVGIEDSSMTLLYDTNRQALVIQGGSGAREFVNAERITSIGNYHLSEVSKGAGAREITLEEISRMRKTPDNPTVREAYNTGMKPQEKNKEIHEGLKGRTNFTW